MSTRRVGASGVLGVLLLISAASTGLDGVVGWDTTTYAAWPSVGLAAALFILSGSRWLPMLVAQLLALGVMGACTTPGPWWQGALVCVTIAFPALTTAWGMKPDRAPYRRYMEDEVDAYHGVTAASGLLSGVLSTAITYVPDGGSPVEILLAGLVSMLAATTAQLIVLPFVLRPSSTWTSLDTTVELWFQRLIFLVFALSVFLPPSSVHLTFAIFPVLGWAALRAPAAEAHLQLAALSLITLAATLAGRGPFAAGGAETPRAVPALLAYMFIASVCYLLVPLALTVERLLIMTLHERNAATTVNRMLDSATGTVFIATDSEGLITHFNGGAQQALGYSPDEVLGRRPDMLHTREEIARQAIDLSVRGDSPGHLHGAAVLAQVARGSSRDWEFRRKDGELRIISLNISEMTAPGNRLVGHIAAGEDITERIRAEHALKQAFEHEYASAQALREANSVKQELVSTVSHELRTPITNIVGYVEMLSDGLMGELPPGQIDVVNRIERNGRRLHDLVDDLLLQSSSDGGDLQMSISPLDLNAVVQHACESLVGEIGSRDLCLTLSPAKGPLSVLGDATLLERAVKNVCSNSIKFTPDGGTVRVAVLRGPIENTAMVVVRDTGIGIPADELEAVLLQFHRTAAAGEMAIQGPGLGLSIVKAIATRHGGDITLQSTVGQGTVATLWLPTRVTTQTAGAASLVTSASPES